MTEKSGQLKWGIAGCGQISCDFVRAMQFCQTKNKICAVATASSATKAKEFVQRNGLAGDGEVRSYGNYAELFADPEVDIVYVANLNHQHRHTVLAALEAGKHVLCEKPMGVNGREVREMVAKARQRGLFLMEGYWTRCFPIWRQLASSDCPQLADIGPLQMVQVDFGFPVKRVEGVEGNQNGGEGYLMAIGCYCLLVSQILFHGERPLEICAKGGLAENGIDLWANVLLRYSADRLAQVFYSGRHRTCGSATIFGKNGNIKLPHYFWSPTEMSTQKYAATAGTPPPLPTFTHCPLPVHDPSQFIFPNSAGLHYEIDHVNGCIREGRTESTLMGLDESVTLGAVLEEVRHKLGVKYPQDA